MASLIFSKKDKTTFEKDYKDYKEPVYVNTQIRSATVCSAAENNDDYEVFCTVNKTSIQDKTSERRTKGLWAQLKDKTVQILFVVQALSIITLIALGVTLTYTGNDHAMPVIAFNAKTDADISLNPNQVIVFKTVLMNYGNAYNNSDGTFYAPADGMYQFNAHLCVVSGGKDLDYAIMVDSDPKISGEYRAPSDADGGKCIGFSVVAVARKLQKVTVSFKSCSSGTGNILFQNRYDWNSFSGILVDTL